MPSNPTPGRYLRFSPPDHACGRRTMLRGALGAAGLAALPFGLGSAGRAAAQDGITKVYIAADDHTDYMWKSNEEAYRVAFLTMLDHYIALAEQTARLPTAYQSRWNCDGSFWLWTYERNRSSTQFQTLIDRIKSGHISVPLNALVSCYGGMPAEAAIRGMYYAGRIERQHGLRFSLAVAMENQTLPYGLGALWAGSGAKYSWRGICGCANKTQAADREHEIYWWTGADGSRILMKWNSLRSGPQSIGGYAEARNPGAIVDFVNSDATFKSRWPYAVIGAFGQGWDDLQTVVPLTDTANSFPAVAQAKSTAGMQVIVSNEEDFFRDFEQQYGAGLPSQGVTFGNEWDLYCASLAEVTAGVKRSVEKLRTAEALATLVCLRDATFWQGRQAAREQACINLGLYWEHNWNGDGLITRAERTAFQRRIANGITPYVDTLHADALARLSQLIPNPASTERFFAFNPLGWVRSGAADFAYAGTWPAVVIDLEAGAEVPAQLVTTDGARTLRVLARNVPACGYKVFELRLGTPQTTGAAGTWTAGTLESATHRLAITGHGAISSLVDKARANREFVRTVNGRMVNDLGTGAGTATLIDAGPVSATVRVVASGPLAHTSDITVYAESTRIDIANRLTQNFADVRTWGFGFELDTPDTWVEEVGALVRARLSTDGGHYALRNARYDWLTLNHFAAMSGGGASITLANADCCFAQLGNSTVSSLDVVTPYLGVLAGGQVDGVGLGMTNQGGDSHFLQRFALQTGTTFDAVASMRMALEFQNPLVTGAVATGSGFTEKSYGLLLVSDPNLLLWALKPAEEGIEQGLVARLWNLAGTATVSTATLAVGSGITSANETTHLETNVGSAVVSGSRLQLSLAAQQMKTYRLFATAAAGAPGPSPAPAPPPPGPPPAPAPEAGGGGGCSVVAGSPSRPRTDPVLPGAVGLAAWAAWWRSRGTAHTPPRPTDAPAPVKLREPPVTDS